MQILEHLERVFGLESIWHVHVVAHFVAFACEATQLVKLAIDVEDDGAGIIHARVLADGEIARRGRLFQHARLQHYLRWALLDGFHVTGRYVQHLVLAEVALHRVSSHLFGGLLGRNRWERDSRALRLLELR